MRWASDAFEHDHASELEYLGEICSCEGIIARAILVCGTTSPAGAGCEDIIARAILVCWTTSPADGQGWKHLKCSARERGLTALLFQRARGPRAKPAVGQGDHPFGPRCCPGSSRRGGGLGREQAWRSPSAKLPRRQEKMASLSSCRQVPATLRTSTSSEPWEAMDSAWTSGGAQRCPSRIRMSVGMPQRHEQFRNILVGKDLK